jgi:hypothetical protein
VGAAEPELAQELAAGDCELGVESALARAQAPELESESAPAWELESALDSDMVNFCE